MLDLHKKKFSSARAVNTPKPRNRDELWPDGEMKNIGIEVFFVQMRGVLFGCCLLSWRSFGRAPASVSSRGKQSRVGADDGLERKTWDCEDKFLPEAPESQEYQAVCGRERPLVVGQMRLFGREKTRRLCLSSEIGLQGWPKVNSEASFRLFNVFRLREKINFAPSGSSLDAVFASAGRADRALPSARLSKG